MNRLITIIISFCPFCFMSHQIQRSGLVRSLSSLRQLCNLLFSTDHQNYGRYLPFHFAQLYRSDTSRLLSPVYFFSYGWVLWTRGHCGPPSAIVHKCGCSSPSINTQVLLCRSSFGRLSLPNYSMRAVLGGASPM